MQLEHKFWKRLTTIPNCDFWFSAEKLNNLSGKKNVNRTLGTFDKYMLDERRVNPI